MYERPIDGFKQCRTCHFTFQIRMFRKHKAYTDGYQSECKFCDNKRIAARKAARVKRELARFGQAALLLLMLCLPVRAERFVDSHVLLVDHHGTPGIFLCQDAECEAFAWHAMHWAGDVLTFNSYGYGPIDLVDGGADIFLADGPYLFKIDELIFDVPYVPSEPYTLGVTLDGAIGWLTFDAGTMTSVLAYGPTGDFQLDGDVDGRDFLTWQRNPQLGDLATWQTESRGLAEISTPEPETLALLLLGLLLLLNRRKQWA